MACCCCQGPGVCCQGTNCSNISACVCQQQGGTFQAGRACQQANVCRCPGQPTTQVGVCEECPPGCERTPCTSCKYHPTLNVTISNPPAGAEDMAGNYTLNLALGASNPCDSPLWFHDAGEFSLTIQGTGRIDANNKYTLPCGFGCTLYGVPANWQCNDVSFSNSGLYPVNRWANGVAQFLGTATIAVSA